METYHKLGKNLKSSDKKNKSFQKQKQRLPPDEIIFREKNQDIESHDCSPDEVIDVITARYELNDVALSRNTEERIKLAEYYNENLKGTSFVTPYEDKDGKHVYHLYILQMVQGNHLMLV